MGTNKKKGNPPPKKKPTDFGLLFVNFHVIFTNFQNKSTPVPLIPPGPASDWFYIHIFFNVQTIHVQHLKSPGLSNREQFSNSASKLYNKILHHHVRY